MCVAAINPSPTMPIWTMGACLDVELLHELAGRAHVGHALPAGFAFDAARPTKLRRVQDAKEFTPIDLAAPHGNLLAPGPWSLRATGILDMTLFDPRRQGPQRLERIALIVEDQVGGIEVHADTNAPQFFKETSQRFCRFLAGLERQINSFGREDVRH